jgi:hypothetical protein
MYTYGISIELLDRLLQTTNYHYINVTSDAHTVYQRDYYTIEILLEAESQIYNAYREQGQW